MRRKASELKPYGSRNVVISGKHQSGLLWREKPINLLVFYLSNLLLDVLKSNSKTLKTFITIKQIPQHILSNNSSPVSYSQVSHGTDCLSNNLSNGLST
jgi:hypothetical protein